MMEEYDKVFPEYGFASNKGYGSADHIAALKKIRRNPDPQKDLYYTFHINSRKRVTILQYTAIH